MNCLYKFVARRKNNEAYKIELIELPIYSIPKTKKGEQPKGWYVWIDDMTRKKYVRREGNRYACPTIEEAREVFIEQTKRKLTTYERFVKQNQEQLQAIMEYNHEREKERQEG